MSLLSYVNTMWAPTSPGSCHHSIFTIVVWTFNPRVKSALSFPHCLCPGFVTAKEKVTNIRIFFFKSSSLIWITLSYVWVWCSHFLSLWCLVLLICIFYIAIPSPATHTQREVVYEVLGKEAEAIRVLGCHEVWERGGPWLVSVNLFSPKGFSALPLFMPAL